MKKRLAILILTAACTTVSTPQSTQDSVQKTDDLAPGSAVKEGRAKPAATPEVRNEIDGLEDIALEYVESTWGKPDSSSGEASGPRVVLFKNIHTTAEDPDSDKPIRRVCDIELKVDGEGTVTDWDYKTCQTQK